MKTFSNLKELNEAKYGQPLYSEKDHMKNLLIAGWICENNAFSFFAISLYESPSQCSSHIFLSFSVAKLNEW